MTHSAREISLAVARLIDYRRHIVVPNVSWGFMPWEMDLCAITKDGFVWEIEVKRTLTDLKKDAEKRKWKFDKHGSPNSPSRVVRRFSYAMPHRLYYHDKGPVYIPTLLPDGAGVIITDDITCVAKTIKEPRANNKAKALTTEQQLAIARLGTMRYWARNEAGDCVMAAMQKHEDERMELLCKEQEEEGGQ